MTLPAYYASALVNGDISGLTEEGKRELAKIYEWLEGGQVIDVVRDENGEGKEPRFTWSFKLYGGEYEGGEVLDYVVQYRD